MGSPRGESGGKKDEKIKIAPVEVTYPPASCFLDLSKGLAVDAGEKFDRRDIHSTTCGDGFVLDVESCGLLETRSCGDHGDGLGLCRRWFQCGEFYLRATYFT